MPISNKSNFVIRIFKTISFCRYIHAGKSTMHTRRALPKHTHIHLLRTYFVYRNRKKWKRQTVGDHSSFFRFYQCVCATLLFTSYSCSSKRSQQVVGSNTNSHANTFCLRPLTEPQCIESKVPVKTHIRSFSSLHSEQF